MASGEELLASIRPGMELTKNFFLRIYGYELSFPGFAEVALTRLEEAGCSKARNYYTCIVAEWGYYHDKMLAGVAAWYRKQDFTKKGDDRNWREAELLEKRRELLEKKLELLREKKLLLMQQSRQLKRN